MLPRKATHAGESLVAAVFHLISLGAHIANVTRAAD
jgi:hypothetical protein